MSRQEERINAKRVFQNGTTKEKLQYLWDYYRWHFIILIILVGILISTIYNLCTKKECVLKGYFLNCYGTVGATEELTEDFLNKFPIDTKSQEILIHTSLFFDPINISTADSYQSLQALVARVAAGEVDFIVADVDTMQQLSYHKIFLDLPDVLNTEQMTTYETAYLYYDKAVMTELENINDMEDNPVIHIAEPSDPEAMEEPVPVMIQISDTDKISRLYPDSTLEYAFAFVANSQNTDNAIEFLDYLN